MQNSRLLWGTASVIAVVECWFVKSMCTTLSQTIENLGSSTSQVSDSGHPAWMPVCAVSLLVICVVLIVAAVRAQRSGR